MRRPIPRVTDQKLKQSIKTLTVVISNINDPLMQQALVECPNCNYLTNEYMDVLINLHASIKNIKNFKERELCKE